MRWRVGVTENQLVSATMDQLAAAEDAVVRIPDGQWYTEPVSRVRVFHGSGDGPPPALMELAYIGRRPC